MKKAVIALTVADLSFIIILAVSGLFSGIVENIVYIASFIVPFSLTLFYARREKMLNERIGFGISGEGVSISLSFLMPSLAVIFIISWLTSFVLSSFSENPTVDVSGNVFYLILIHALIPTLLEEGMFRYLPLKLLTPFSARYAVLISAMYFSLIHCNLYQIPYAFAAGLIFAVIDIACKSILPSFVFHFANNIISIIWMKYAITRSGVVIYICVLFGLALISLIPIMKNRKAYSVKVKNIMQHGKDEEISYLPLFFTAVTLLMAVLNLS